MIMLGPVLERIDYEVLKPAVERTWAIMLRSGIIPSAPPEIQGKELTIDFVSMLAVAQDATQASSIERVLGMAGSIAGVDPSVMDNIDVDYSLDKFSSLLNNDPKMIRSPDTVAQIRAQRQQQQQAEQMAQKADTAQKLAVGAKTLSETPTSGDNLMTKLTGAAP
jgi:hypothetical protein